MKRLLLIAFILTAANVSFSQNYILLSTGATGPTGTGNSAIYQDPATSNIGIGNVSPAATLDVWGVYAGGGVGYPPEIISSYYDGAVPIPIGTSRPNHFLASHETVTGLLDPIYSTVTDFSINSVGQVGIGAAANSSRDLFIQDHTYNECGFIGNAVITLFDNANNFLLQASNMGSSTVPSGGLIIASNSAVACSTNTTTLALGVFDQSGTLTKPLFSVVGQGVVSIGASDPLAQLDIMQNNSVTDYLFHVGSYASSSSDFFSVHNDGYVGIGKLNPGNALVEVSDVNGLGASNIPLFTIDNGEGNSYLRLMGSSGSSGGTSLQLFSGSNAGWPTQIQFWNADATAERHLITDDFGTGNLLIWPGWSTTASNVVEIAGSEQIDGTAWIGYSPAPEGQGSGTFPTWSLSVDGQVVAKEIVVTTTSWADTVFSNTYQLKPLADVESYIKQNHHLPEVPAASEVVCTGISLGDMNKMLMQKVEELTLYTINLEKRLKSLEAK